MKNILLATLLFGFTYTLSFAKQNQKTEVEIRGDQFFINGEPTYAGQVWKGNKIEGLLMNARLVQGLFDDLNPETVYNWAYPDTKIWDADRNTDEFVSNMSKWKSYGMLSFTLNLQGGSPFGYSNNQPWINSTFDEKGKMRKDYLSRLERILDEADRLGMVPILGLFYFGQDENLKDEKAVIRAAVGIRDWLLKKDYRNILIEVNNECNIQYDHEILKPDRVHELIELMKTPAKSGKRLLVSTSYGGGSIPKDNVVQASDFILLHGNGVKDPKRIIQMVEETRKVAGYTPKPILFNEDDHFNFEEKTNNFTAAVTAYSSWGYFDFRMKGEGFAEGYQSVPVDWGINSVRKKGFFGLMKEITGF